MMMMTTITELNSSLVSGKFLTFFYVQMPLWRGKLIFFIKIEFFPTFLLSTAFHCESGEFDDMPSLYFFREWSRGYSSLENVFSRAMRRDFLPTLQSRRCFASNIKMSNKSRSSRGCSKHIFHNSRDNFERQGRLSKFYCNFKLDESGKSAGKSHRTHDTESQSSSQESWKSHSN